jgi:hypothetical protein
MLVGPAGTVFIGGSVGTEATVQCAIGPPAQMGCGPTAVAVGGKLGFTAFLQSAVPCGSPFQFWVSSTGAAPYSRVGDAVFAGSCTAAAPAVVAAARVRRVSARLVAAVPPSWNEAPARVAYAWQRCVGSRCSATRGGVGARLRVTPREVVRVVVTATFSDGTQLRSMSKRFVV